jgi:hypothetical protein
MYEWAKIHSVSRRPARICTRLTRCPSRRAYGQMWAFLKEWGETLLSLVDNTHGPTLERKAGGLG